MYAFAMFPEDDTTVGHVNWCRFVTPEQAAGRADELQRPPLQA